MSPPERRWAPSQPSYHTALVASPPSPAILHLRRSPNPSPSGAASAARHEVLHLSDPRRLPLTLFHRRVDHAMVRLTPAPLRTRREVLATDAGRGRGGPWSCPVRPRRDKGHSAVHQATSAPFCGQVPSVRRPRNPSVLRACPLRAAATSPPCCGHVPCAGGARGACARRRPRPWSTGTCARAPGSASPCPPRAPARTRPGPSAPSHDARRHRTAGSRLTRAVTPQQAAV